MAELQLERRSAEREAQNLMTKTDPEDRFFAHQIAHGFVRVGKRLRIARAIGEENSGGIESERFICRRRRRNNRHLETFLAQQAQDVFLDAIVICDNPKSDWWQRPSVLPAVEMRDRPWGTELVLRIPAVNLLCRNFAHVIHPN